VDLGRDVRQLVASSVLNTQGEEGEEEETLRCEEACS
jgi:hypothetical protein